MNDSMMIMGISNILIALIIAAGAWIIGRYTKYYNLSHLLWILVLIKLLIPSFLNIPVIPQSASDARIPIIGDIFTDQSVEIGEPGVIVASRAYSGLWTLIHYLLNHGFLLIWLFGSLILLLISLFRIIKYDQLLQRSQKPAPDFIFSQVGEIAGKLGIKKLPLILLTTAKISPTLWWTGGKVRIFLPSDIIGQMAESQIYWVLAHEIAHMKRRDHYVRWLEWLATVVLWWNPLVWLAKYNLRPIEEICCDALVISRLRAESHSYASAILTAVKYIAQSFVISSPSLASNVTSGGDLTRRFGMMISNKARQSIPKWLIFSILSVFLIILPLSFGCRKIEREYNYLWDKEDTSFNIKLQGADSEDVYVEAVGLTKEQVIPMVDKIGEVFDQMQPNSDAGVRISISTQDFENKKKSE